MGIRRARDGDDRKAGAVSADTDALLTVVREWIAAELEVRARMIERLRSASTNESVLWLVAERDTFKAELERVKADASAFATDAELASQRLDKALSALRIAAGPGGASPGWCRERLAEIEGEAP